MDVPDEGELGDGGAEEAMDFQPQKGQKRTRPAVSDLKTFDKRSIFLIGASNGITSLTEDACDLVANQLFHKTRELIFIAKILLHQNKRDTLTTEDIQKAIKLVGGVQLFGHTSEEEPKYLYLQKKKAFIEANEDLNLFNESLSEDTYYHNCDPYIQGAWVVPKERFDAPKPEGISSYYVRLSKTLMHGYTTHKRVALLDLRSNPKIGPDCPFFLNLVALTVKKAPQNDHITTTMIDIISCIAENRYVDPSPYLAVNRAVNSLLKIVIEKKIEKTDCDDLPIRLRAGLLLSKVMILWSIELKQQIDIVKHLLQHFLDNSAPFQTQYGAIVTLTALGQRTLDFHYWPVIERYLLQLENRTNIKPETRNPDPFMVYSQYIMGALLVSLSNAFRKIFTNSPDHSGLNKDERFDQRFQVDDNASSSCRKGNAEQFKTLISMDKRLYAIFGDSVTPLRMLQHTNVPPTYLLKPKKRASMGKLKIAERGFYAPTRKYDVRYEFEVEPKPPRAERAQSGIWIKRQPNPHAVYYRPTAKKQHYFFVQRKLTPSHLSRTCSSGNLLANF